MDCIEINSVIYTRHDVAGHHTYNTRCQKCVPWLLHPFYCTSLKICQGDLLQQFLWHGDIVPSLNVSTIFVALPYAVASFTRKLFHYTMSPWLLDMKYMLWYMYWYGLNDICFFLELRMHKYMFFKTYFLSWCILITLYQYTSVSSRSPTHSTRPQCMLSACHQTDFAYFVPLGHQPSQTAKH